MPDDDLTAAERIEALERANARLSKLLAISEFQKERLKKQCTILKEKCQELLINSQNSS
jgi:hypothetical protein